MSGPIDGRPVKSVLVSGKLLDDEDSFCYLGDILGAGGGFTQAVIARCGVAWGKFRKLLPVLTSRHLPFKVKGREYNSCVRAACYMEARHGHRSLMTLSACAATTGL